MSHGFNSYPPVIKLSNWTSSRNWGFNRKITELISVFSSTPCLMKPGVTFDKLPEGIQQPAGFCQVLKRWDRKRRDFRWVHGWEYYVLILVNMDEYCEVIVEILCYNIVIIYGNVLILVKMIQTSNMAGNAKSPVSEWWVSGVRKSQTFCGPFSSTPCLMTPDGKHNNYHLDSVAAVKWLLQSQACNPQSTVASNFRELLLPQDLLSFQDVLR